MLAMVKGNAERRGALLNPSGRYWWIWPTGPMGQTGWDMLRTTVAGKWEISESRRRVIAPNGAEIWVKSSDHEDGLRGAGLDGVAFAECREMRGRVWHEVIRPALADRKGWALFETTPRGFDWFHDLETHARAHPEQGWAAWHFSSYDNPELDPKELDAAKTAMTERMYQQEILAQYLTDGAYFQNIDECATVKAPHTPGQHLGHSFGLGLDWGKSNDFTVITVICRECSQVVDWLSFNQIDYTFQRARVKSVADKWPGVRILPERNSIGQPNIEMLREMGLLVEIGPDGDYGYNTTASSKAAIIEALALALAQKQLAVPEDYASELRAFEIETRPIGVPKFGAPQGQHDDKVMSLALAWRVAAGGVQFW